VHKDPSTFFDRVVNEIGARDELEGNVVVGNVLCWAGEVFDVFFELLPNALAEAKDVRYLVLRQSLLVVGGTWRREREVVMGERGEERGDVG